jgi:hypothetical protein
MKGKVHVKECSYADAHEDEDSKYLTMFVNLPYGTPVIFAAV